MIRIRYGNKLETHTPPDDNEQHVAHYQKEDIFMPKTKFEDAIYTIIMATIMVYGMIVYNVALNTGGVSGQTFLLATHEMIIMVPVAFVLEFFIVGKIAQKLAFTVMKPTDHPASYSHSQFPPKA